MNRKEGYYWVIHRNGWEVGCWQNDYWLLFDSLRPYLDGDMEEINETQILPPNN